jgi:CRISPR/Cas system CSM-associated protein Csm2 small subunit
MTGKNQDYTDILKNLIKPGLDPVEATDRKIKKSLDSWSENNHITPAGILYMALLDVYGIDRDMTKFEEFQKYVLERLSKLSTAGRQEDLFGENFNSFYAMYVETLNICGRMKETLEENGIDFDFNNGKGESDDD